jgi:type IV secretion system protein VirD4
MVKVLTTPVKVALEANKTIAEGFNALLKTKVHHDPRGIGRMAVHSLALISTPYILSEFLLPDGYELGPFGLPIFIGGLIGGAHAWWKVYRGATDENIYGSARFAELSELKEANLTSKTGAVLGKVDGTLIIKPESQDGHILVLATTGGGKTKSLAIPSVMRWRGSVVCMDIKGEVSEQTRKIRGAFYEKVIDFNPESKDCWRYNPLALVKDEGDAEELANILCPIPSNVKDPFWYSQAQRIIKAAVLEAALEGQSISYMAQRILATPNDQLLNELMGSQHKKVSLIASAVQASEQTLAGIMSNARDAVEEFGTNDAIIRATSGNEWSPADLDGEGATVYLTCPEDRIKTYSKLFALIYCQIMQHLVRRKEWKATDPNRQPPVLLLLDEFGQLGKLPNFQNRLSTVRSRGVTVMIFAQSFAQFDQIYGRETRKIIDDNCRYQLILSINDNETARMYSERAGKKTVETKNRTVRDGEESESFGQTGIPLIRTEEWSNLEKPVLFFTPIKRGKDKAKVAQVDQVWFSSDRVLRKLMDKDYWKLKRPVRKEKNIVIKAQSATINMLRTRAEVAATRERKEEETG